MQFLNEVIYGHYDRCRGLDRANRLDVPQLQVIFKVVDLHVVAMRQIPFHSPDAVHMVVDVPVVQLQRVPQVMAQTAEVLMPFCVVGHTGAGPGAVSTGTRPP